MTNVIKEQVKVHFRNIISLLYFLRMKIGKKILSVFFLCFLVQQGTAIPQNPDQMQGPPVKVVRLLLAGERLKAAGFLSDTLQAKRGGESGYHPGDYLTLAVLWSLADSADRARAAYNIYIRQESPVGTSQTEVADKLLYHSLSLGLSEQYNRAADSLVKSLLYRTDTSLYGKIITAESCRALARFNKKTGDGHQSLRNYNRSLTVNRELRRSVCIADDLTEMSIVISGIDNRDPQAEQALFEALRRYRQIGKLSGESTVYNELGVLFASRHSYDAALYYLKKSLAIKESQPLPDHTRILAVLNNIGTIYFYKQNTDSSDFFFSRALDLAKRCGMDPAPLYANLGVTYASKGDFDHGLKYFQLALSVVDSLCLPDDLSSNPRIQAATPRLAEYTSYKAHAFNKRFIAGGNGEDLIKGLETYQVALEMMDTLRYLYSFESKPLLSQEFKIHYFQALEMALDLYRFYGQEKYLDAAFELSARNKAATLNEFLRTNHARQYLGSTIRELVTEDSLKQELVRLQSKMIEQRRQNRISSQARDSTNQAITRATDELISLQSRIRKENPELYRLIYSSKGYPPDTIQGLLAPDEALVDYTMTDSSYLVAFVLTHDTIHYFRDTLGKQFFTDIIQFKKAITSNVSSRNFQDFIHYSHRMYRNLVAPAAIPSSIKKLVVLPDEEIGFLPFEIFLSDSLRPIISDFSKLHYLNRIWSISYISSLEQLVEAKRNKPPDRAGNIIAMAPFAREGIHVDTFDLPPLKYSELEINAISKDYRLRRFVGHKASKETFLSAFNSNSILQISTHGILDMQNAMQTRILLSPRGSDGSVYLFELLSARIRSPLVVLNACNTGTGRLQVGEGIMSMSKALQFAGVPSLVTTLWPVDDRSSALIISYFFNNLKRGMERGEALQAARNQYLDETTLTLSAPFFWAGQVLIGDAGTLEIRKDLTPWFLSLGGVFLVGLLAVFFIRLKKKR